MTQSPSQALPSAIRPKNARTNNRNRRYLPLGAIALMVGCLSPGCQSRPSAPELSNAPVYHNRTEGLRFLVPEGWNQTTSAVIPPGELDSEVFLVRYVIPTDAAATMQVICMNAELADHLEQRHQHDTFGISEWKLLQPGQTVNIHGVRAQRWLFESVGEEPPQRKHMTCFRHRERAYAFVGLYLASDDFAQQQVERAVDSVIWEP
ncbi:MAG: hypothetical protein JSS02_30545 [Planctomycetes bacterium]|nr:hypothetical protein [Planctomycetota bacterium]